MSSRPTPAYPFSIWDGTSRNTQRLPGSDLAPDWRDWDRVVSEVISIQTELGIYAIDFSQDALRGHALYVSNDNIMSKGLASDPARSEIVGVARRDVAAGEPGIFLSIGPIGKEDWTEIVGTPQLVPQAVYYLSPFVEGTLTTVPPSLTGHSIVKVGTALSSNIMDIGINPPILL